MNIYTSFSRTSTSVYGVIAEAVKNGARGETANGTASKGHRGSTRKPVLKKAEEDSASKLEAADKGVAPEAAEALIEARRLGERIRFLRQRKQMGLVELGKYTGLSASFLSQLETGRVVPTLRNLARIAMVFSRNLSYFFEPEEPELFHIVRASERQKLPQTGVDQPGYFFESLGQVPGFESNGQKVVPYIAEFLPLAESRHPHAHQHPGSEFLYMLSGRLKLTHDGREDLFEAGDAVYFHASATHSYERVGDDTCTALILTMPPQSRNPK